MFLKTFLYEKIKPQIGKPWNHDLTVVGSVDLYTGDTSNFFILRKVSWGQYKNKLVIWLFSTEPNSWDMAQYVKIGLKMKTEKTEKWWYFLKDDDHRWLFDNRNIYDNNWKTAKPSNFVTSFGSRAYTKNIKISKTENNIWGFDH